MELNRQDLSLNKIEEGRPINKIGSALDEDNGGLKQLAQMLTADMSAPAGADDTQSPNAGGSITLQIIHADAHCSVQSMLINRVMGKMSTAESLGIFLKSLAVPRIAQEDLRTLLGMLRMRNSLERNRQKHI